MKKLIAIFFLLIYAGTALGVAINFHYCSGYLDHIAILNLGGHVGCSCDPKDMPKDCCKDKLISFKTDNHRAVQQTAILQPFSLWAPLLPQICLDLPFSMAGGHTASCSFYSQGRSPSQPIYLIIGVFRI